MEREFVVNDPFDPAYRAASFFCEFFQSQSLDRESTAASGGIPQYRTVDFVKMIKRGGNGQSVSEPIAWVRTNPNLWPTVEPAYEAWRKGQTLQQSGTGLAMWPPMTPAIMKRLEAVHIYTVEELAALTDSNVQALGIGIRELRDKARAWVDAEKGRGAVAAELEARDRQIAELKAQMAVLLEEAPKKKA